jgi:hypothetical protein
MTGEVGQSKMGDGEICIKPRNWNEIGMGDEEIKKD